MFRFFGLLAAVVSLAAPLRAQGETNSNWKTILRERIPLYGHRNWIVIADSAYPAQAPSQIETVVSNADHFEVLQAVLRELDRSRHVRPVVYVAQELEFVDEKDAQGISAFRDQLSSVLGDRAVNRELLHGQLIEKLAQVSQNFRVLIVKTTIALPYTSVFLELDPAYWTPEAERRLRASIKEHSRK